MSDGERNYMYPRYYSNLELDPDEVLYIMEDLREAGILVPHTSELAYILGIEISGDIDFIIALDDILQSLFDSNELFTSEVVAAGYVEIYV